jgi:hypothetical protein
MLAVVAVDVKSKAYRRLPIWGQEFESLWARQFTRHPVWIARPPQCIGNLLPLFRSHISTDATVAVTPAALLVRAERPDVGLPLKFFAANCAAKHTAAHGAVDGGQSAVSSSAPAAWA